MFQRCTTTLSEQDMTVFGVSNNHLWLHRIEALQQLSVFFLSVISGNFETYSPNHCTLSNWVIENLVKENAVNCF